MPDFIMPPRSLLMISLLRHAHLQQGLQLHHKHATLRKLYERHLDCVSLHYCKPMCLQPVTLLCWYGYNNIYHFNRRKDLYKEAALGVLF